NFSSISLERNIFGRDYWRRLPSVICSSLFLFTLNFFGVVNKATQDFVNRSHWSAQATEVVTFFKKQATNVLRRESFVRIFENETCRVSDSQLRKVSCE